MINPTFQGKHTIARQQYLREQLSGLNDESQINLDFLFFGELTPYIELVFIPVWLKNQVQCYFVSKDLKRLRKIARILKRKYCIHLGIKEMAKGKFSRKII